VRLSFAPGTDPRRVVVVVDVIEKNTGSLALGGGISSASGLFGSVSYQQQNLGGNNQTLGAEVQVGLREFLFDARFTDPLDCRRPVPYILYGQTPSDAARFP
jgi:outer membrane protein insertion porin family